MNDVLGIGSIEILLLLVTSSFTNRMPFFPQFIIPPENELIKDNGILIPIVFTYGAVMVAANLTGSLRKKWGGYFVVGRDFILVKIKGLMSG